MLRDVLQLALWQRLFSPMTMVSLCGGESVLEYYSCHGLNFTDGA